jgi:hypothetical protein
MTFQLLQLIFIGFTVFTLLRPCHSRYKQIKNEVEYESSDETDLKEFIANFRLQGAPSELERQRRIYSIGRSRLMRLDAAGNLVTVEEAPIK